MSRYGVQPWPGSDLVKPPKTSKLPDIVTVEQAQQIFNATRVLSYRVFFFTIVCMGLRLGEGLRLQVGDIDAGQRMPQAAPEAHRDICIAPHSLPPGPSNKRFRLRLASRSQSNLTR